MWSGKKVLLGVTGSIAAYKSTYLVRLLVKAGAEVKVILTPSARDFVTPLTLATLSKNPVLWEFYDEDDEEGKWNNHVDLGLWADLFIIAPASSNTLSKMVSGTCDNLLMGVYLSAKCPVFFAPAMDLDMYQHPSTRQNIEKLQSYGNYFIPSGDGELASGLSGEGRMAEPEEIVAIITKFWQAQLPLKGKKILINAGPTQEPIDPVRYIGNHSSGKMGVALAEQAAGLGAEVYLVLGPGSVLPSDQQIRLYHIQTAAQMNEQCQKLFPDCDGGILAAAIADYRPADVSPQKMKKTGDDLNIRLVENPDILRGLGKIKRQDQFLVGFALETNNPIENARKKLHKKNCDLIVLNSPGNETGFGTDTNQVTLIDREGKTKTLDLKSKHDIAKEIITDLQHRFMSASWQH